LLLRELVHLDYNTINLVLEGVAFGFEVFDVLLYFFGRFVNLVTRRRWKSPGFELLLKIRLGLDRVIF
jgi:hypothetical protein